MSDSSRDGLEDLRQHWPAAERNKAPILEVLREVLPGAGLILEVASGTGQHVAHFASQLPELTWQPSDADAGHHPSISAWSRGRANVRPPILLDVTAEDWGVDRLDAIYSANMIHIAPWSACLGLLRGAGAHLRPGGVLALYGPFKLDGAHTAPSNAEFDRSLQARDSRWGVRDLDAVRAEAESRGLAFERRIEMPANNQLVVFGRTNT